MKRIAVRINGEKIVNLGCTDFVSRKVAHWHLFKHVVRICDLGPGKLRAQRDPEKWDEVMGPEVLTVELPKRREETLKILAETPGCVLGRRGPTSSPVCGACCSEIAQQQIDQLFEPLGDAYLKLATRAVEKAFETATDGRPQMLSFMDPRHNSIRIVAEDDKHIHIVGVLDEDQGDVKLVSCYRRPNSVPRNMAREQAGHRLEETAVRLELVQEETRR